MRICAIPLVLFLATFSVTAPSASGAPFTFTFDTAGSDVTGTPGLSFPHGGIPGVNLNVTAGFSSATNPSGVMNRTVFHDRVPANGGLGVVPGSDNLEPNEVLYLTLTFTFNGQDHSLEFEVTNVEMNGEHQDENTAETGLYYLDGTFVLGDSGLGNAGDQLPDALLGVTSTEWAIRNDDTYNRISYVESITVEFDEDQIQEIIPEPSSWITWSLIGLMVCGVVVYRRRTHLATAV